MPIVSQQAKDIGVFLEKLDALFFTPGTDYGVKDYQWGDGFRAEMVIDEIPVYSDVLDSGGNHIEKLGVFRREDFNWFFYPEVNNG